MAVIYESGIIEIYEKVEDDKEVLWVYLVLI